MPAAAAMRSDTPSVTKRVLLKNGTVLSMDPELGDFARADVLVEGSRIVAVAPNLEAAQATVVDCDGMIVMPGFIDTHHHQYETVQRSIIADGVLRGEWPERNYVSVVQQIWTQGRNAHFDLGRSPYTPHDSYISELVASLSQIDAGVTTGVYTSQSSRAFDVPLVSHAFADFGTAGIDAVDAAGLLGPDQVYIHATQFSDRTMRKIADSGGHLSIATTIEMAMGHGMPPIQQALDHGILPSLSTDVETNMAADMFSVMRATFTLQRALIHERRTPYARSRPYRGRRGRTPSDHDAGPCSACGDVTGCLRVARPGRLHSHGRLCPSCRRRSPRACSDSAGRSGLALLHERHHGPPQGRDAEPPQPPRDDPVLLRGYRPHRGGAERLFRRHDVCGPTC
jgi:hypothetical protein